MRPLSGEEAAMTDTKTHVGGCHCGKVRFEVQADVSKATACNCSICMKTGWLLAFAPAEQFKLLSGEDVLSDYQFGKKHIHHVFCSNCGVRSFSRGTSPDGREMYAVNLRCLDDASVDGLAISHFDGKSL
jgi:hypothetical protein